MEATGSRIVKYADRSAVFSIYDIADIHWGNRGVAKDHLTADIARIETDPYAMFFIGGDYIDFVFPSDPRFDPESIDENIKVVDLSRLSALLASSLIRLFAPVKGKCLGVAMGNHEKRVLTGRSEMFVHEEICKHLGAPNMRYSGWTDIYFVHDRKVKTGCTISRSDYPPAMYEARLRVFLHHGMGAANTAGGKINKLKALVDMVDADLVMMGHVHEQFSKPFVRLLPDESCSTIGSKVTMGLITGSYLRTYAPGFTGYGEERGFSPTTLGATCARYSPATRRLVVENAADNVGRKG